MTEEVKNCSACGKPADGQYHVCRVCRSFLSILSEQLAEQYYRGAGATREHLKAALEHPSCTTCKHGSWMEDRSVGIDLHLEDCEFMPVDAFDEEKSYNDADEFYIEVAKVCGHWTLEPSTIGPQW